MEYEAREKSKYGVYIIPAFVYDENTGEMLDINELPDFRVFTDVELAKVLAVSNQTIRRWLREGLIPYCRHGLKGRFREYHIPEVIKALKKAGYTQKRK